MPSRVEVRPNAAGAELSGATPPEKMVQREFARTASRLREMRSKDYFERKHASAANPQVMVK